VIIVGGHNYLVCAGYPAASGLKVRVLGQRQVVGGVSGIPGHDAAREILGDR
jgi:phytoene dehydrogenase-like protein